MARQDIAGLLTGIPSGRPDPMGMGGNASQQRLAFGAQRAEGLQRGVRGLMGQDTRTPAEQLQMAMAQLDMSNPDDLRKIAQIQQATGDLAGAAQTASRIQAMKQAAITEDRAARNMEIKEETFAMQKAASERELDREDAVLAQQGVSRLLFAERAKENGNEELANGIMSGAIPLEKAVSMVFGGSNALVKPPTSDEKIVFNKILESEQFEKQLTGLKTGWWVFKTLNGANKQAIYFKAKEYMVRQGLSSTKALEKAVKDLENLNLPMGGGDTDNTAGTTPKAVDNVLQDISKEATTPTSSNATRRKRRQENVIQDISKFATLR